MGAVRSRRCASKSSPVRPRPAHRFATTATAAVLSVAMVAATGSVAAAAGHKAHHHHASKSHSAKATSGGSSAPGVDGHTITVGAIATLTGPIAANFDALVPGEEAYFKALDKKGGVNGHTIDLRYPLDDGGNPSQFAELSHSLVDQDHVFAVTGVASAFFSPNYFVETKTPTFGYVVSDNWAGPANLFGAGGSIIYYKSLGTIVGFVVHQLKVKSIAVLALGLGESSKPCNTAATQLKAAGYDVSYVDTNVGYGASLTSDVQRIEQAGSDFVVSCMDVNDNISLARAVDQYGLHVKQFWLNGNDRGVLAKYHQIMQNVYFQVGHVPFAFATTDPKGYPGIAAFVDAMKKYEPKYNYDELALDGWESASLFAAGVKAAGNDLTQANVIDKINQIKSFTGEGISAPVDWTRAHTHHAVPYCQAFLQVKGTQFVPAFDQGHHAFVCLAPNTAKHPKVVTAPKGTPGG